MFQGNKFQKGRSVNPKGKTKGTKNKVTLAAQALLEGELDNICQCLVQEALAGNIQAIKMVLDRVLPFRRDYPTAIELQKLQGSSDALQAIASIAEAWPWRPAFTKSISAKIIAAHMPDSVSFPFPDTRTLKLLPL